MVLLFITSTLSMLATLAIAYGIDQWIYYQQRIARRDMSFPQAYLWAIIGGVVLLVVWIALGWFVLAKSRRIRSVSIIFIVTGILAFLWFPLEEVSVFWITHLFLFPNFVYNLQFSGLFIAVLGCLTLFIPKGNPARA
jgi:hypothetical protein